MVPIASNCDHKLRLKCEQDIINSIITKEEHESKKRIASLPDFVTFIVALIRLH